MGRTEINPSTVSEVFIVYSYIQMGAVVKRLMHVPLNPRILGLSTTLGQDQVIQNDGISWVFPSLSVTGTIKL